jgi:hypothetical protein
MQRRQKNLSLSTPALEELRRRSEQTGLNESRVIERLLDPGAATAEERLDAHDVSLDALDQRLTRLEGLAGL